MRNPVASYMSLRHQLHQQGRMWWSWTCAMTTNGMLDTSRAQTGPKRSATSLMQAMCSVSCFGLDCGVFFCNFSHAGHAQCVSCLGLDCGVFFCNSSHAGHVQCVSCLKPDCGVFSCNFSRAGHAQCVSCLELDCGVFFCNFSHAGHVQCILPWTDWLIQHHVQHSHAGLLKHFCTLLPCK